MHVCGKDEEKEEWGLREGCERVADERRGDKIECGYRIGHGVVGEWRDTVNRWEAINFGLECPIAPHFVQCKFTPDANRLARALRTFSSGAAR